MNYALLNHIQEGIDRQGVSDVRKCIVDAMEVVPGPNIRSIFQLNLKRK